MPADREELGSVIRRALPDAVAFAGGPIEGALGELFPAEAAAVETAVAKRRDEFTAGRTYARRALAELGAGPVAIPVGERRAPVWPAGIVGSISHCKGYGTAVAARARDFAGIGIDVELDEPVSAAVAAHVCSEAELRERARLEPRIAMDLAKLLFSIKESVYKAYFPLALTFLDFSDVAVDLQPDDATFAAHLTKDHLPAAAGTRVFSGRYARAAGIVAAWTIIPPATIISTIPFDRGMALRKAASADRAFVERVYFDTQRHIIEALFGWRGDDVERSKFAESYDMTGSAIILVEGEEAGWFTVQRLPDHIHLDAIYLREEWQRQGIGSRIIRGLIREAADARVPLRLSTAKINEARRLYERLGFEAVREDDFKVYMETGAGKS